MVIWQVPGAARATSQDDDRSALRSNALKMCRAALDLHHRSMWLPCCLSKHEGGTSSACKRQLAACSWTPAQIACLSDVAWSSKGRMCAACTAPGNQHIGALQMASTIKCRHAVAERDRLSCLLSCACRASS